MRTQIERFGPFTSFKMNKGKNGTMTFAAASHLNGGGPANISAPMKSHLGDEPEVVEVAERWVQGMEQARGQGPPIFTDNQQTPDVGQASRTRSQRLANGRKPKRPHDKYAFSQPVYAKNKKE